MSITAIAWTTAACVAVVALFVAAVFYGSRDTGSRAAPRDHFASITWTRNAIADRIKRLQLDRKSVV